jgi:NAD(P)-dependent dehydrogenase (short-subunit alcohol dehydrogenase family)
VGYKKAFANKVVVITGAGSGIGRATALAFGREGAKVHLVDVDRPRVEEAQRELEAAGAKAVAHVVDCADSLAVLKLAERVYSLDGRVDVLHNNAGVCCGGAAEKITLEDWRWTLDTNVWGVIHGIHAFLPRMIAQGKGGAIVNTASMAGLIGLPFVAPYCASKFAVVGLSEALCAELAVHGIAVTTVCPGMVRTQVLRDAHIDLPGNWLQKIHRLFERSALSPEEMAKKILRAVRKKKSLVLSGSSMVFLWGLKRFSSSCYHALSRWGTKWVLTR